MPRGSKLCPPPALLTPCACPGGRSTQCYEAGAELELQLWAAKNWEQRAKMVAKQTQYHLKTELCSVAISEQFRHGEFSSAS